MTPAPPAPSLRTDPHSRRLTVTPTTGPDGRLTYKLRVSNDSADPWHDVRIEFRLPAGVRGIEATGKPASENARLIWHLPALAPADATGATVTLLFDPLLPTYDAWVGRAVAYTVKYRPPAAPPRLMLAVSVPEAVSVGEPFAADIRVTNLGDAEATGCGVYIDELTDAGDRCASGRHLPPIGPGLRRALRAELTATRAGSVEWRFTATLPGGDPVVKVCSVRAEAPAAAVALAGPDHWPVGRPLLFHLSVTNTGPVPLNGATVRLTPPAALAVLDDRPPEFPPLPPGGVWEHAVRCRAVGAGAGVLRAELVLGTGVLAVGERAGIGRFPTADDPLPAVAAPKDGGPYLLFTAGPVRVALPADRVAAMEGAAVWPVPGSPDWIRGVVRMSDRPVPVLWLAAWAGVDDPSVGTLWAVRDAAGFTVGVLSAVGAEVELIPVVGSALLPHVSRRVWGAAVGRAVTDDGRPVLVLDPARLFPAAGE